MMVKSQPMKLVYVLSSSFRDLTLKIVSSLVREAVYCRSLIFLWLLTDCSVWWETAWL